MVSKGTQGRFEDILVLAGPKLRPLCESLRNLIASLHDGFVEIVWPKQKIASFGVGPKKMSQHYAYIAVHSAHVNLGFYRGAGLADPHGLLEGSGKNLRHVKLYDLAATRSAAISELLRQAIAELRDSA